MLLLNVLETWLLKWLGLHESTVFAFGLKRSLQALSHIRNPKP